MLRSPHAITGFRSIIYNIRGEGMTLSPLNGRIPLKRQS